MNKALTYCLPLLLCAQHLAAAPDTDGGGIRVLLVGKIETTLSGQINALIQALNVKLGDSFKRGDKLVEFDCRLPAAELSRAEAQAQAARKTLEANLKLQEFKAVSGLEVALAEADVLKAQADVTLYRAQVSLCDVRAPFAGKVVTLHTTPYASVAPGVPLLDVIDDSQLEMQLHVPSAWLDKVRKGSKFSVRIDETGKQYSAEVIRVGARIDAVSQTLEAGARIIDKDPALLAGMSGTARFE